MNAPILPARLTPGWPFYLFRFATRYALIILIGGFLLACSQTDKTTPQPQNTATADATVGLNWMDTFLQVERYAPGYRPPVAARALAYINLAAYETMVPGQGDYASVAGKFAGLTVPAIEAGKSYRWDAAVHEAYYVMMKDFFPNVADSLKSRIETTYSRQTFSTASADDLNRSKAFGRAVATAVFEFSRTDAAGHEAYLRNHPADYVPPTGAGKWQPTYPDYSRALLPYWGKVRTFVATGSDLLAKPPLAYASNTTSPLFVQGLEIYAMTTPLSYENKWIGEFWSDDIYKLTFEPAGRWVAIAQQVIRAEKVSLPKAIYTYAKLSLALSDAGVACWNSKYIYSVERPVSYIRRTIDPAWKSSLNNPLNTAGQGITPPFPAYPSGHSTFGGVAAEVLTNIYGDNYAMTDNCHKGRTEFLGTPRAFGSFYDMATENAYSRINLGVHYRMDCEEGLRMGYVIGRKVNQMAWTQK